MPDGRVCIRRHTQQKGNVNLLAKRQSGGGAHANGCAWELRANHVDPGWSCVLVHTPAGPNHSQGLPPKHTRPIRDQSNRRGHPCMRPRPRRDQTPMLAHPQTSPMFTAYSAESALCSQEDATACRRCACVARAIETSNALAFCSEVAHNPFAAPEEEPPEEPLEFTVPIEFVGLPSFVDGVARPSPLRPGAIRPVPVEVEPGFFSP